MLNSREKGVLLHKHEANRCRLFGYEEERKKHELIVEILEENLYLKKRIKDEYENSIRKRFER